MCLCSRAWCRARAAGEKFVCVSARSAVGQPFVYSRRVVAINERTPKCLTNYKFSSELTRLPKIFSTRKGNVTSLEASPMHRISEKGWTLQLFIGLVVTIPNDWPATLKSCQYLMKKSFVNTLGVHVHVGAHTSLLCCETHCNMPGNVTKWCKSALENTWAIETLPATTESFRNNRPPI